MFISTELWYCTLDEGCKSDFNRDTSCRRERWSGFTYLTLPSIKLIAVNEADSTWLKRLLYFYCKAEPEQEPENWHIQGFNHVTWVEYPVLSSIIVGRRPKSASKIQFFLRWLTPFSIISHRATHISHSQTDFLFASYTETKSFSLSHLLFCCTSRINIPANETSSYKQLEIGDCLSALYNRLKNKVKSAKCFALWCYCGI